MFYNVGTPRPSTTEASRIRVPRELLVDWLESKLLNHWDVLQASMFSSFQPTALQLMLWLSVPDAVS